MHAWSLKCQLLELGLRGHSTLWVCNASHSLGRQDCVCYHLGMYITVCSPATVKPAYLVSRISCLEARCWGCSKFRLDHCDLATGGNRRSKPVTRKTVRLAGWLRNSFAHVCQWQLEIRTYKGFLWARLSAQGSYGRHPQCLGLSVCSRVQGWEDLCTNEWGIHSAYVRLWCGSVR